jgi:hypothetical protein
MEDNKEQTQEDTRSAGHRIREMHAAEKIKLATFGDKEARAILIQENDRTLQLAVVRSPRITESEICAIANSRNVYEDVLRVIMLNREWMKVYQVRMALVQNPKVSPANAIRILPTLREQDLKKLARSKSMPNAVVHAARRLVIKKR